MPGVYMNQTSLTITGIVLTSLLSTVGAIYQTNKANEEKEQRAVVQIVSEFNGVKTAVSNFSSQLNLLSTDNSVLKTRVLSLEESRREFSHRLRSMEIKVGNDE